MCPEPAKFIHDTQRILDVNQAGCDLFHCDRSALVDLDMISLIVHEDFRGLARLRMQLMRQLLKMPNIKYKFLRCDGTHFWGTVSTVHLPDGTFETTVVEEF